jgi:hypothetical protein
MDAKDHERPAKRARLDSDDDNEPMVPYLFLPFGFDATFWLWTPPPGPDGETLKTLVFKYLQSKKLSNLIFLLTNSNTEEDLAKDFPDVAAFANRGCWEALLSVGVTIRANVVMYDEE